MRTRRRIEVTAVGREHRSHLPARPGTRGLGCDAGTSTRGSSSAASPRSVAALPSQMCLTCLVAANSAKDFQLQDRVRAGPTTKKARAVARARC